MRRTLTRSLAAATFVAVVSGSAFGATDGKAPGQATRQATNERAGPAARTERAEERGRMVDEQIDNESAGRTPVTDERVLAAMRSVPRHEFVPEAMDERAYADTPLSIGHGQTISQPYIVAFMTEMLRLGPSDKVLEIGTGSGYQAAVLAELVAEVYTIEILRPLAERAQATLARLGYENIHSKQDDGYKGWPEHAPFDAIIVTAAAGHVPPPLWEQLAPGGRMAIPVGGPFDTQRLVLIEKSESGERSSRAVMAVRFVPFTRAADEH